MPSRATPLIDELNPLYCPAVPPAAYLNMLRNRCRETNTESLFFLRQDRRMLFAKILLQAFQAHESVAGQKLLSASSSFEYSTKSAVWDYDEDSTLTACDSPNYLHGAVKLAKRKRTQDPLESYSDLQGPAKYARSCPSIHDSSFEVGLTKDTLQYSKVLSSPVGLVDASDPATVVEQLEARVAALEDELRGPILGTETPRGIKIFVDKLDTLLPGIRLKERLNRLSDLSHQTIVDFLGSNGLLNPRVLDAFRMSEVRFLTLDKSLAYENGLNVDCYDTLTVFGKANSYLFLAELSISGTPLRDTDIMHIHHLPRLTSLFLEETTIGNEAVFLLASLKRSLAFLSVSHNPAINDDAVPALLVLSKLEYLSILGTGIRMPGLRKFAKVISEDGRPLRLDCPAQCEKYITRLHTQYLISPAPPLIVGPELCGQLSAAALKRNLAAHAVADPTIFAGGGKQEMVIRLREILERRKLDLLVRDLIFGAHEEDTVEVDEEIDKIV